MAVILPHSVAAASAWSLSDFVSLQRRSEPAAGGVCTVDFGQLDGDERWLIDHAVIVCDSATPTSLRLYQSSVADQALLDGSAAGNFDVADWPNGLAVEPSQSLVARWTGASAGARGVLTLQARVLRRS